MAEIATFTFNPFSENTFVVFDETKECVIVDPGCYQQSERTQLSNFIEANDLKPVRLLNTHAHLDHIFGNQYVYESYGLLPEIHEGELPLIQKYPEIAAHYGIPNCQPSPLPKKLISPPETIHFGNTTIETLFAPGHSPASICFYFKEEGFVIAGDVLFAGSIGRTDLPGGDFDTLIDSIKTQLMPLSDEVMVFPGHGPSTTIGQERAGNPFLQ